jgi:outer membrane protein assembly factor BamB
VDAPTTTTPVAAVAFQSDAAHDGHVADRSFSPPLTELWSADLGGTVFYPVIAGNEIFIDSGNPNGLYGTDVEARSLTTGQLMWGPVSIGGSFGFGSLAYDRGRLFALNGDGVLTAFDPASGAVQWPKQLPGQYSFTAAPTAYHGTVYISGAGSAGTVYAVDEADGTVKWSQPVENGDESSPAVNHNGVFVAYACEQAYSFTLTGLLRWHHSTRCEGGGGRTGVLHHGHYYVRDNNTSMSPKVLTQANGSVTGHFTSNDPPAFSRSTMITLTYDSTRSGATLTATNITTGKRMWRNSSKTWMLAPLIVNGYVVDGAADGTVNVLNKSTGAIIWSGDAGSQIQGPNEGAAVGLAGLAESEGTLVVPAGTTLTVFAATSAHTPSAVSRSDPPAAATRALAQPTPGTSHDLLGVAGATSPAS